MSRQPGLGALRVQSMALSHFGHGIVSSAGGKASTVVPSSVGGGFSPQIRPGSREPQLARAN